MKNTVVILCFALACFHSVALHAQPVVGRTTPVLPAQLKPTSVEIPEAFRDRLPANLQLNIPEGYRARIFYAGPELTKPRFMAWGPDSVLHVTDLRGGIYALPDTNRDGIADRIIEAAANVQAHDIRFFRGKLYAAQERQVLELSDADGDGIYETRRTFIDGIAEGATQPGGGHTTRTLVFDSLNQTVFLSIGSRCNVCREDFRAKIEAYDLNGQNRSTYATGIRNAVGMTLHPRTGRLWATNNGSDRQGDNLPTEWIDLVRRGGFYGYPFAFGDGQFFDFTLGNDYRNLLPITSRDSAQVRSMVPPAALIQAHTAPMAIEFANDSWPTGYQKGAFVALRGSWNRSIATGYKIVYLQLSDDQDTTFDSVTDFISGFLTDSIASTRWARPVGLATDVSGRLYLTSDDINPFVMIVEPIKPTGIGQNNRPKSDFPLRLAPDPDAQCLRVYANQTAFSLQSSHQRITDLSGRLLWNLKTGSDFSDNAASWTIAMNGIPAGIYVYHLQTENQSWVQKLLWLP